MATMYAVAQQTFLADVTQKVNRGKDIGRYHMVIGILTSVFTLIGGLLVDKIAFGAVFVFLGIVFILDTAPLFFLREKMKG